MALSDDWSAQLPCAIGRPASNLLPLVPTPPSLLIGAQVQLPARARAGGAGTQLTRALAP